MKEIDFKKGFESTEEAKKVVKQIQDAFDEIVTVNNEYKEIIHKANSISAEYKKQAELLAKSNEDMREAFQNMFAVLGSKKDLWEGDVEMGELMNLLAKYVISTTQAKLQAKK